MLRLVWSRDAAYPNGNNPSNDVATAAAPSKGEPITWKPPAQKSLLPAVAEATNGDQPEELLPDPDANKPKRHQKRRLDLRPAAMPPVAAGKYIGVGRTKMFELIGDGSVRSTRIGRSRVVFTDSLDELLARLAESGGESS